MEHEPLEGHVHRNLYCDRILKHPPELVWRALTEASSLSEWLMRTDFEPVVDRPFHMETRGVVISGKVLEVRPFERLAYHWKLGDMECRLVWLLEPIEQGTNLNVHENGTFSHQDAYQAFARNPWPMFMAKLSDRLSKLA